MQQRQKAFMSDSLRRQISSPVALFVFEATARCGSFHAAALELNVTQPSVSYQIKKLEKHLGTQLFDRRGRNIVLTDEGEILFKAIERGFASIQLGLTEITHKSNANLVTFCSSSSAASNFLLPRMFRLREAIPALEISVKILNRDVNPAAEDGDFSIRLGGGDWEDLDSWHLFDEVYFPLSSPGYFKPAGEPVTIERLKDSHLLYLKERFRARDDWRVFFDKAGSPLTTVNERTTYSDQQALLAAVTEGQGVGIGWLGMTDHLLETGMVSKPTDLEVRTDRAFYLVSPKGMRLSRTAIAFRDWMISEGREIQRKWEETRSSATL